MAPQGKWKHEYSGLTGNIAGSYSASIRCGTSRNESFAGTARGPTSKIGSGLSKLSSAVKLT